MNTNRFPAVCVALVLAVLCTGAGTPAQPTDPRERFKQLDRDGDGKVTRKEAGDVPWFDRLDRNRDGAITRDEVPARGVRPVRRAAAPAGVTARPDVAYGKHKDQRLDVYAPAGAKGAPVMVYVHGGGWRRGDKSAVGLKVEFFTGRGWVFVSTNYRLLPDGKHPANVRDVAAALAWVHDHIAEFGGKPSEMFLMGHSAGAHLAALVATDDRPLKAAGKSLAIVKGVIPLDTNTYDLPTLMQPGTVGLYGQVFGSDPKVWRDASPLHHVARGKGIPPMLICYSRGMGRVLNPARPAQAGAFAKTLQAAGVRAEVVDARDRNHGQINAWFGKADDKVTKRAVSFLQSLRDKAAAKAGEVPPRPE